MLDRMVEKARQQEVCSREDTPTERRVEAAFLYHAGVSYRRVKRVVGRSYEAVRQWYHRVAHLFEPDPDDHSTVAVDETKVAVQDREVYVWAAVDVETFDVIHIEVSPGRSDLDALVVLKPVLQRCRGPWYNWALDDLDLPCESRRETWGGRSLVKPGSACSHTEPGASIADSPPQLLEINRPLGQNLRRIPQCHQPTLIPLARGVTLMKVLVPVDGSDCSFRALEFATQFVRRYEGTIHVVHLTDHEGEETNEILERAETVLADADLDDDPEIVTELGMSEPRYANRVGKDVLRLVEEREYDHVVMGHHGTGRIGRAILGSAADTVVRAAEVSCTIIP